MKTQLFLTVAMTIALATLLCSCGSGGKSSSKEPVVDTIPGTDYIIKTMESGGYLLKKVIMESDEYPFGYEEVSRLLYDTRSGDVKGDTNVYIAEQVPQSEWPERTKEPHLPILIKTATGWIMIPEGGAGCGCLSGRIFGFLWISRERRIDFHVQTAYGIATRVHSLYLYG